MSSGAFLKKLEVVFEKKFIIICSTLVGICLLLFVWDVCFWPTDTEVYYLPASEKLFSYQYLSEIHQALDEGRVKWLHGKELFVLSIAIFQKIFNDILTLKPVMFLGVLLHVISSFLIFINFKRLWGREIAFLVYFLFMSCLWPYVYILFGKHQTQGLTFFLLSAFFIMQKTKGWRLFLNFFLSSFLMGVAFFSSTVSIMYFPYLGLLGIWNLRQIDSRKNWLQFGINCGTFGAIFAFGFILVLGWVTYPNIIENTRSYFDYVGISSQYNHFFYNQVTLGQWIPDLDPLTTRGGWVWVIKYFLLVMPVIFILFLASIIYLLKDCLQDKKRLWPRFLLIFFLAAVCFSTPLLIEIRKVAQYGANYFTSLIGMLGLIAFTLNYCLQSKAWKNLSYIQRNKLVAIAGVILLGHFLYNIYAMASDILPARMGTAYLARTLEKLNVRSLDTYKLHPLRPNVVDVLPSNLLKRIQWTPIENILQGSSEFILVPPVSKDTIYQATQDYTDFDEDIFLNVIVKKAELEKYAIASFPSIGSSLIWSQEEEILSYRYLVLNQFPTRADKSRIWLLDRKKIVQDKENFLPSSDDIFIMKNGIRNIGTKSLVYMFKGYQSKAAPQTLLLGIAARVYKIGDPQDSLVAYLYRVDEEQPLWIPFDKQFRSRPLPAKSMTENPKGQIVRFEFDGEHLLNDQPFFVAIYRTGPASDKDYYRVYESFIGRIEGKDNIFNTEKN